MKHKPVTPLPFSLQEMDISEHPEGHYNTVCRIRGGDGTGVADYILGKDAAYIVDSCNAYPRLVARVKTHLKNRGEQADEDLLRELGEI